MTPLNILFNSSIQCITTTLKPSEQIIKQLVLINDAGVQVTYFDITLINFFMRSLEPVVLLHCLTDS
jgi:hypothetical protein